MAKVSARGASRPLRVRAPVVLALLAVAAPVAVGAALYGCRGGSANDPPVLVIAVGQPGSVLNAVGTGVAKLVAERTGIPARVRVTPGMDALVGAGDAELGVSASDSTHLSSHGLRHYEGRPQKKLRLALPGPPLLLGFIVPSESDLHALTDLRGRRVPGEYPNARPMYFDGVAMLSTVGMTWDELAVLPVAGFRDGIQALIEGRAEAAIASVGSGLTEQADASLGGVRFLTLPGGEAVSKRMWEEAPGFHALPVAAGSATGVVEDVWLAGKEAYLTANADVDADAVYAVVSLLWHEMDRLSDVHPIFADWNETHMSNPKVTIPFHDGTVRLLKEQGRWTAEHDRVQQELLAALSDR